MSGTSAQCKPKHACANHNRSSSSMEVVRAYSIFECSKKFPTLRYREYYGDGDSKVFDAVKNIYGKYSVCKLECIGHIQKKNWDTFRKTDQ